MSNIKLWSTTPASNNSSPPQGAPEGMAPSTVNDIMRQQMSDHRTQWEEASWFDYGYTISYVAATQFKFGAADRTALAEVSRRVRAQVGAGTIYGLITASSYSAPDTTVTVSWDSGSLDASLSGIAISILSFGNSGIPPLKDTFPIVAGSADPTKKVRFEVDGLTTATTRVLTAPDSDGTLVTSANLVTSAVTAFTKPTRQIFTSGSGTYTTPAGVIRISVRMVGGGGGGGGGPAGLSIAGGNTTFSTFTASGGAATTTGGGAGGAASGGTVNIPGGGGGGGGQNSVANVFMPGGSGGASFFGGHGGGGVGNQNGSAGATNSGGGGGGGGGGNAQNSAGGGGSGGYVEGYITTPAATYSYGIGAGGAGGIGATTTGGAGAAGYIIVEEFYV